MSWQWLSPHGLFTSAIPTHVTPESTTLQKLFSEGLCSHSHNTCSVLSMVVFPLLFLTFDTVNHIPCSEALSCPLEVNNDHFFSFPHSRSFPMRSFQIVEFGLPLFSFMLSLWDLSQISHSYIISKSVTLPLTALLPPQP